MIVESLRYWVTDYHIDGFRFDLAAILGRDQNGNPMSNPPLLESLAHWPTTPYLVRPNSSQRLGMRVDSIR